RADKEPLEVWRGHGGPSWIVERYSGFPIHGKLPPAKTDAATGSQQVAQILQRKARQRDIAAARERHDLEGFAHLLGHDEAACLAREPRALHGVVGLGHEALETPGE